MSYAAKKLTIFGRATEVVVEDLRLRDRLFSELALYSAAEPSETTQLRVVFKSHGDPDLELAACPREHGELADGFVMKRSFADASFHWITDGPDEIEILLHLQASRLKRWRGKWRSMQFTSTGEFAGQVLHELGLVPGVHLSADLVPLHASSMILPSGHALALGGTGGVGKTSLELELCLTCELPFLADDISVVDTNGNLWPNFNFPKIYGYNIEENDQLASLVIPTGDLVNSLHWRWHARGGLHRVRRRLDPDRLYPNVATSPAPLGHYILLVPTDASHLELQRVDTKQAAAMSLDVLQTEFQLFHRHLNWHSFNCQARGMPASLTLNETLSRWETQLNRILHRVNCYLLRIPTQMPHAKFKREAADLILRRTEITPGEAYPER
jgi:hypothetical protein